MSENVNNSASEDLVNYQSSYIWTIKNFIKYLKKDKPHEIRSPILKTRISKDNKDLYPKWYIDVQFNNKTAKEFISLHLNLISMGKLKNVNITLKFSIVNASGNLVHQFECDHDFIKTEGFGIDEYVKKDYIIQNQENLLSNNKFKLFCEIINHGSILIYVPNALDISEDFEEIFEKKLHSDITVVGNNKVFPVHKVILSARSSVFLEMLTQNPDVKIEIKDFKDEVIEELLRFIYSGKVENINKIVEDLMRAAEMYKLDELRKICIQVLAKTLDVQNVVKRLLLAENSGIIHLKMSAVKFLFNNRKEIVKTEDYKLLQTSHPQLLADAFSILLNDN